MSPPLPVPRPGRPRTKGEPMTLHRVASGTRRAAQWAVAEAFVAAARDGDLERLVTILDPDVVLRSDGGPDHPELVSLLRGPDAVAARAATFRRFADSATRMLVNGVPGGVAWTPDGRPFAVLAFTVSRERITSIEILADPDRLAHLDLDPLAPGGSPDTRA